MDLFNEIILIIILTILFATLIIGPILGLYQLFRGKSFIPSWIKGSIRSAVILLIIAIPMVILIYFDGTYSLAYNILTAAFMAVIIGALVAPIAALVFKWTGKTFKSSYKYSNIFFISLAMFIFIIVAIVTFYEDKAYVDELDKKYQETTFLTDEPTMDKILHTHFVSGIKRQMSVSVVINNYNEKSFKGTLLVTATKNGEILGTKKLPLDIMAGQKGYSDYVYLDDLNARDGRYRTEGAEFTFEMKGEFY
ncbi:hypothetical protein [Mesobacillus jeotgali]|uniref:hypothetical protein n=1 Tax=Mesobacillus jeotgali TaxID=129985 RepID=UPI0009A6D7EC|nr:hypothetical protein [Mesobacillus jeotgali]